jgi:hypothetical protein
MSPMKNFLSDHAKIRLAERSRLTEEDLLELLDNQLCVTVGVLTCSSRFYKLIYSRPDAAHLVVVHDMVKGGVVTILHLDHEGERVWRVTKKELKRAKQLGSSAGAGVDHNIPPLPGVLCWINLILNPGGFRTFRASCGTYRFAEMPTNADDALRDPGFVEELSRRLQERKIPMEAVEEILLTDKDQHIVLRLPWHVLENFPDDRSTHHEAAEGPHW